MSFVCLSTVETSVFFCSCGVFDDAGFELVQHVDVGVSRAASLSVQLSLHRALNTVVNPQTM